MAVSAIIQRMTADGVSATVEHPGGTWSHSPEYFKYRYGARKASPDVVAKQKPERTSAVDLIIKRLDGTLTRAERQLLIAQLEDE